MMGHRCRRCSTDTIFFIWSTSRGFPSRQLIRKLNVKSKEGRKLIMREGVPVCFQCFNNLSHEGSINKWKERIYDEIDRNCQEINFWDGSKATCVMGKPDMAFDLHAIVMESSFINKENVDLSDFYNVEECKKLSKIIQRKFDKMLEKIEDNWL